VEETKRAIEATREAGKILRAMPAPKRGEVVRQIREVLSANVNELGDLVSLEMGKIKSEGKGEVQEVCLAVYTTGDVLMLVCGHCEFSGHKGGIPC